MSYKLTSAVVYNYMLFSIQSTKISINVTKKAPQMMISIVLLNIYWLRISESNRLPFDCQSNALAK